MLDSLPQIECIDAALPEDLTPQLLTGDKPVVLRGIVNHWPLVQAAMSSDAELIRYLAQFAQPHPVQAFCADAKFRGRFFYNDDLSGFNFTPQTTSLGELLSTLQSFKQQGAEAPGLYLGSTSVDHILPGLRQHNDLSPLQDTPLVSIWIGNRSRVAAHYDAPDNLACCIAGRRRFILFPPEQLPNLYIGPLDFTPAGQPASLVDFHQPDFDRYPRFRQALEHARVAELEPGDAIFVPSMWWHHVEGLTDLNVLINYWWRQVGHQVGAPADALMHAILSIRDLPQSQRKAWQDMFDHYVFSPQPQEHIPQDKRGMLNPIDDTLARQLRARLMNKLNR